MLCICRRQVFRRHSAELSSFTLVGQTVFEVADDAGLGELLVDVSADPLAVRAGDLLGMHVVDAAVVPFDEDPGRMTTLYWRPLDAVDTAGHTVDMDADLLPARTYSLSARIAAAHGRYPRRLYILCWRKHSRRKLSPTLATPTTLVLTTLVAQCELSRR